MGEGGALEVHLVAVLHEAHPGAATHLAHEVSLCAHAARGGDHPLPRALGNGGDEHKVFAPARDPTQRGRRGRFCAVYVGRRTLHPARHRQRLSGEGNAESVAYEVPGVGQQAVGDVGDGVHAAKPRQPPGRADVAAGGQAAAARRAGLLRAGPRPPPAGRGPPAPRRAGQRP